MNIAKIETYKNNIWKQTFDLHKTLAKKFYDKQKGSILYKQFLNNQINNPTLTNIAMQTIIIKYPVEDSYIYFENMFETEEHPEIKLLDKIASNRYETLYPKTGYIRERLINFNRFDYLSNKAKPKMNLSQKLKVKFLPII